MKKIIICLLLAGFLFSACKAEDVWFEPVIAFYLDKNSIDMNVGSTETLNVTIKPQRVSDREVTWLSSNEDIASVNKGKVKAIAPGRAVITVSLKSGQVTSCAVNVAAGNNAEVSGIEIIKMPDKLMYLLGEEIDLKGIAVTVIYDDGASAALHITGSNISGFDTSLPGEKTLTLTHSGKLASFKIMVLEVLEIEITGEAVKKTYNSGEHLDITGLEVTAYYFDGTDRISGIVSNIEDFISGFDSLTPGTKNVTITYGGLTVVYTVTVSGISSIQIFRYPDKEFYRIGETLSIDGLIVNAAYTEGGTHAVDNSLLIITGFDSFTAGVKIVTVSYGGEHTYFSVTVIGVTKIEIISPPNKTVYKTGDILDITGIEVTAFYSDSTSEAVTITAANITGFNSNSAGVKNVSVNFGGVSAAFTVTVTALSSIEVSRAPNKTDYIIGEALDITGLEITAVYTYSAVTLREIITVTASNITGFNASSSGTKTLTVVFLNASVTFNINVLSITGITLSPPVKTIYKIGEALEITGLSATASYIGGLTGPVPVTLSNVSLFDSMSAGIKTLTVTIDGKTAGFTVTVLEISSLAVTKMPVKTVYRIGEPLVISGIEVQATYSFSSVSLTETVQITTSNIIGFNSSTAGTKTLMIIYSGKTANFNVTVVKEVTGISVTKPPIKTEYVTGESLNIAGIEVTASYNDNSTGIVTVSAADVTGFNSSVLGDQNLTVTYQGKSAIFTVVIMYSQSLNITFEQIKDEAPVLSSGVIIYLNTGSKTAVFTVTNPSQYSNIVWAIPGTGVTGNGASFTINSANTYYNRIGKHFVMVEVIKEGLPYSRTIEFEVRN